MKEVRANALQNVFHEVDPSDKYEPLLYPDYEPIRYGTFENTSGEIEFCYEDEEAVKRANGSITTHSVIMV